MIERKAVVLLSGGIDSSTTLAWARSEGFALFALSIHYAQRHRRELLSARMVARALGVKRHLVISLNLRKIGGSALTADIEVPRRDPHGGNDFHIADGTGDDKPLDIPLTYVPARNTIFLSIALGWAEVLAATDIFIGATAVDYSGYPDCRPEYFAAFEAMANLATKASVEGRVRFTIRAPLIGLKKSDIIREGIARGIDYALTWSCYDPQPGKFTSRRERSKKFGVRIPDLIPCGTCDSCIFRAKGFREAGIPDPLLEGVSKTP